MKAKRYRQQPIRRVCIPKDGVRRGRLGFRHSRTTQLESGSRNHYWLHFAIFSVERVNVDPVWVQGFDVEYTDPVDGIDKTHTIRSITCIPSGLEE